MADTEVDMGRPITCGALAHIMSRESTLDGEQLQLTMRLTGLGSSVRGEILLFLHTGELFQCMVITTFEMISCGNGLI